eukprot:TRINITY_DN13181_c0_g1_i1.p1 TRINITY_DN13181_c0_g1~~TRINITY_DN13181_c0_g1_i1.p1  ORF type:complete len:443 (-),score=178.18 TRINITY_DN13181_c0_g1_i1:40-1368(-)
MEALLTLLKSNPYFSAGFGLVGVGAGLALLRRGSQSLMQYGKRQLYVSIELPSTDKSYWWLMRWMRDRAPRQQHLTIRTSQQRDTRGVMQTDYEFLPGTGNHLLRYQGAFMRVERKRERLDNSATSGTIQELLIVTMLGHNKHKLFALLDEAKSLAQHDEAARVVIMTALGHEWRPFGPARPKRDLSSVVLQSGVCERLVRDVSEFMTRADWYRARGIPWRRGYLLHGPPGTGKSSLVHALASHFGLSICLLSLNDRALTDDRLMHLLTTAPDSCIVLLEDIDAAFQSLDQVAELAADPMHKIKWAGHTGVTYSGLLNALDGVASGEGRICFMTTNHLHKLPPALIRPGRIDLIQEIGLASRDQIRQLFLRFYPVPSSEDPAVLAQHSALLESFSGKLTSGQYSTAQLQGHLLHYKDDARAAVERVDEWIRAHPSHVTAARD